VRFRAASQRASGKNSGVLKGFLSANLFCLALSEKCSLGSLHTTSRRGLPYLQGTDVSA
jgi:hypothetical protein